MNIFFCLAGLLVLPAAVSAQFYGGIGGNTVRPDLVDFADIFVQKFEHRAGYDAFVTLERSAFSTSVGFVQNQVQLVLHPWLSVQYTNWFVRFHMAAGIEQGRFRFETGPVVSLLVKSALFVQDSDPENPEPINRRLTYPKKYFNNPLAGLSSRIIYKAYPGVDFYLSATTLLRPWLTPDIEAYALRERSYGLGLRVALFK